MSSAQNHARSSAEKFGGEEGDYLPLHSFLDSSKPTMRDYRHRALLHHDFGLELCVRIFGPDLSGGISTRLIAEQHLIEDHGYVPKAYDWLVEIAYQPWMLRNARDLRTAYPPDPDETRRKDPA